MLRAPLRASTDISAPRVALLDEEPAGKIITRSAGTVELCASLWWRRPEDVPSENLWPEVSGPVRTVFAVEEKLPDTGRSLRVELRALDDGVLGDALNAALRSVTATAALTDAVLETAVVRLAPAHCAAAGLVERMARDLWRAGYRVRFGASWTPVSGAALALGAGDRRAELESFLLERGLWEVASRLS